MLTKKKQRPKRAVKRKDVPADVGKKLFWVRPSHPDLDRAGDLLLERLAEIRSESEPRAITG